MSEENEYQATEPYLDIETQPGYHLEKHKPLLYIPPSNQLSSPHHEPYPPQPYYCLAP